MKFQKKRRKKPLSYGDRVAMAGVAYMVDRKLGYDAPTSVYERMWNIDGKNQSVGGIQKGFQG